MMASVSLKFNHHAPFLLHSDRLWSANESSSCLAAGRELNFGNGIIRSGFIISSQSNLSSIRRDRNKLGNINRDKSFVRSAPSTQNEFINLEQGVSDEAMVDLKLFLEDQLPKLFDEGGMDDSRFDAEVDFRDPITKYGSLQGYLFNIAMLRVLFQPVFELQYVRQTGPAQLTTRWTMTMKFSLLPWRPRLVFTGLSLYGVNPKTLKFNSHIDVWDSIQDNEYFSAEGLQDLLSQAGQLYSSPTDGTALNYRVLQRRATYEIRKYSPHTVVQVAMRASASSPFSDQEAYRQAARCFKPGSAPGQPAFSLISPDGSQNFVQLLVLPSSDISVPDPGDNGAVQLVSVPAEVLAVRKVADSRSEQELVRADTELRTKLQHDGLLCVPGWRIASYRGNPLLPFLQHSEVLVGVENFQFE